MADEIVMCKYQSDGSLVEDDDGKIPVTVPDAWGGKDEMYVALCTARLALDVDSDGNSIIATDHYIVSYPNGTYDSVPLPPPAEMFGTGSDDPERTGLTRADVYLEGADHGDDERH